LYKNGATGLKIDKFHNGIRSESTIPGEFWESPEFKTVRTLSSKIKKLSGDNGGILVVRKDKEYEASDFDNALNHIMTAAKKGLNISRYKGLGEMNPDQLWETTMDPSVRRLLKVVIEDNVSSDDTFTILMGDQVEPRRKKGALSSFFYLM